MRSAAFLVLALALVAPLASAGGPAPGPEQLVTLAPLLVEARATATLDADGIARLAGEGELSGFVLTAERLRVTLSRERAECVAFASVSRCAAVPGSAETEIVDLRAATLRAKGATADAFEAAVSLRARDVPAFPDAPAGRARLAHATAPAELGVASAPPVAGADALPGAPDPAPQEPAFAPGAHDFAYAARDATLTAEGRLAVALRGVAVQIVGTDADGKPVDRVVVTGPSRSQAAYGWSETDERLVAEAAGASLELHHGGEAVLFGRPSIHAYDGIRVTAAVGSVHAEDARRDVSGTMRLAGEMRLVPADFRVDEDDVWLVLDAPSPVATAASARAASGGSALVLAAAAAGAGAGGLAGLLVVGAPWLARVRLAAGAALAPLYSRIARDEVLDHRHRERILRAVTEAPGITPRELAKITGLVWTSVAYHLRRLEASGHVSLERDGRRMRFYAAGAGGADARAAYAVLRNATTARLATLVSERPGLTQKDAAQAIGVSPSLLAWHADRLEGAGLLVKERERGRVRYREGPAWSAVEMAARRGRN